MILGLIYHLTMRAVTGTIVIITALDDSQNQRRRTRTSNVCCPLGDGTLDLNNGLKWQWIPKKRKIFIESSVKMCKKFDFDGIDFDWEYPGNRDGSDPDKDREDFSLLVEEFAEALHAEGLLLSAATSPDPVKAGIAYDVKRIAAAMDFINVMDYDYHGGWDDFTGVNTPLYGRTEEEDPEHPGHLFNVNDTVSWYIQQGAPRDKINIGAAAYGRGFTLPKGGKTGLYCPTEGPMPS